MADEPIHAEPVPANPRDIGHVVGRVLLREPTLIISFAYALTSLIGVWGSYWYYHALGVPILQFLQVGDFFTAGLRDPFYIAIAVGSMLLSWLLNVPYGWRFSQPDRYARLRGSWWFRAMYPHLPTWTGMQKLRPGIGLALGMLWMTFWLVLVYVQTTAERTVKGRSLSASIEIDNGSGTSESVVLLGTTSAYVFVWHPQRHRAEVFPIEGISRMALLPKLQPDVTPATVPAVEPVPSSHPAPSAIEPSPAATRPVQSPPEIPTPPAGQQP